ncbi:MAG: hypothetical protein GEU87_16235 [Alphaproteobacteria bacterium]|nr:hypothetical protein [Alphaproteobacteria bacterium]
MDSVSSFAILGFAAAGISFAAQAADSGKIIYGAGNCFVIETGNGSTLFERSGGQAPKPGETVTGVLSDFGYQQLFDTGGKALMVGFVQEYAVKKAANIDAFKKSCR